VGSPHHTVAANGICWGFAFRCLHDWIRGIVCSQNLTGRLIIRRGREVGDGTGGGGETVEDGQESGVNAQEEVLKEEEVQEVVMNGELLRILQDQDVEIFENAVSKSCIFEGVTSYDQLFKPPTGGGGGKLFWKFVKESHCVNLRGRPPVCCPVSNRDLGGSPQWKS
jgi:hypothetical protein